MRSLLVLAAVLLTAAPAAAQLGGPNFDNPHPAMPWAATNYAGQYGTPVRQYYVEPQVVALLLPIPGEAGLSEGWQTQYAVIPAYYVTETTTGMLHYPARWAIDQLGVGVYQWRRLPAEVRRR